MLRQLASRVKRRLTRPQPEPTGWVEATRLGLRWNLCLDRYLDREVYHHGAFEPASTRIVQATVKPGMRILDIGANFGYFTTLFAHLVGPTGHVWAFEPTQHYGSRIATHLRMNHLTERATVSPYGLSDKAFEARISIDESSATLHQNAPEVTSEQVRFEKLDDVAASLGIDQVDLVKIDTDGHELAVLHGAQQLLRRTHPIIFIEFSQANLDLAGSDVRELHAALVDLGYELHSETTGKPFDSRKQFLAECGNYTHSANVWAYPKSQAHSLPLNTVRAAA